MPNTITTANNGNALAKAMADRLRKRTGTDRDTEDCMAELSTLELDLIEPTDEELDELESSIEARECPSSWEVHEASDNDFLISMEQDEFSLPAPDEAAIQDAISEMFGA